MTMNSLSTKEWSWCDSEDLEYLEDLRTFRRPEIEDLEDFLRDLFGNIDVALYNSIKVGIIPTTTYIKNKNLINKNLIMIKYSENRLHEETIDLLSEWFKLNRYPERIKVKYCGKYFNMIPDLILNKVVVEVWSFKYYIGANPAWILAKTRIWELNGYRVINIYTNDSSEVIEDKMKTLYEQPKIEDNELRGVFE